MIITTKKWHEINNAGAKFLVCKEKGDCTIHDFGTQRQIRWGAFDKEEAIQLQGVLNKTGIIEADLQQVADNIYVVYATIFIL